MNFLLQKSVRTACFYVLGCCACLFGARAQRLSLCADWRFAALRELQRPERGDADVLFMGSSCTARGVRPRIVAEELASLGQPALDLRNLAVMGEPRHVNFLQLESYLRDHEPPRVVFAEVGRVDEPDRPHPALTGFMGPRDAVRVAASIPYRWKNPAAEGQAVRSGRAAAPDTWLGSLDRRGFHLEFALEALGRGPEDFARALFNRARNALMAGAPPPNPAVEGLAGWSNPYWAVDPPIALGVLGQQLDDWGWYRTDADGPTYAQGLERVRKRAARVPIERAVSQSLSFELADSRKHRAVKIYTAQLARLCERHGIRLVFMHLPGFREKNLSPEQVELYTGCGDLFRPDLRALFAEVHYADPGHLTESGAAHYSRELAGFLAGILKP